MKASFFRMSATRNSRACAQVLVHESNDHGPLTDGRGDTLDRVAPHVSGGEDARQRRFEMEGRAAELPAVAAARVDVLDERRDRLVKRPHAEAQRVEDMMVHRMIVPIGHAAALRAIEATGDDLDARLDEAACEEQLLAPAVPPATRTFPFGSKVAVCPLSSLRRLSILLQVSVIGL